MINVMDQLEQLPGSPAPKCSSSYEWVDTRKIVEAWRDELTPVALRRSAFRTREGAYGLHDVEFTFNRGRGAYSGEGVEFRAFFLNTYNGSRRPAWYLGLNFLQGGGSFPILALPGEDSLREAFSPHFQTLFEASRTPLDRDASLRLARLASELRETPKDVFKTPYSNLLLPRRASDIGSDLLSRWRVVRENTITGGLPCRSETGGYRAMRALSQLREVYSTNLKLWGILKDTLANYRKI